MPSKMPTSWQISNFRRCTLFEGSDMRIVNVIFFELIGTFKNYYVLIVNEWNGSKVLRTENVAITIIIYINVRILQLLCWCTNWRINVVGRFWQWLYEHFHKMLDIIVQSYTIFFVNQSPSVSSWRKNVVHKTRHNLEI